MGLVQELLDLVPEGARQTGPKPRPRQRASRIVSPHPRERQPPDATAIQGEPGHTPAFPLESDRPAASAEDIFTNPSQAPGRQPHRPGAEHAVNYLQQVGRVQLLAVVPTRIRGELFRGSPPGGLPPASRCRGHRRTGKHGGFRELIVQIDLGDLSRQPAGLGIEEGCRFGLEFLRIVTTVRR